ncbi:LOW QUALITY PROTEIN: leucine-rich alpha-2-glycoprotein [Phyllostomus discolor]|uniref:LOW QUALITY PROTEIN: leucine-rich alpha-2-glycoprotein n=1 Tax=Phyllostomus discolor TaxID=89673 RepID=A0A6J2MBW8_9CHIR|nr:LOW QUALITY PROTEIN: leucine-rich alpha-2-glycoprotein [Phyllostomus discolor]
MEKREATMSSWSPELTRSPGGLDLLLSRTLFLLLITVAPSAQRVTPSPDACLVFQSENGSSVTCQPPAKFLSYLRADTTFLSVEFYNLTQLPPELLQDMSNLQELHLSSNGLKNLSAKFLLSVPRLKVLDLTRNALTRLPPGLFQNSAALHTLVLTENQLDVLEASWLHGLKALGHLDLSGNRLQTLPNGLLANFTDLRILDLSKNQLETLPPDLLRGPLKLERLHLEGNRLRTLEEDLLVPQPNLHHLFLSNNQLATVAASTFRGLKQLDMLDLSNNLLTSVPKGLWASLGKSRAAQDMKDGFDISGNPWVCDQNLDDLYQWLVDNKDKMFFRNNTCCAEPKAVKGQTLLAVAITHLKFKTGVEMGGMAWQNTAPH